MGEHPFPAPAQMAGEHPFPIVQSGSELKGCIIPCSGVETRDWYAWNNLMPPRPNDFHVVGEVFVPNPGVVPMLIPRVPQGFNPKILLMELVLRQRAGVWPRVFVWVPVRYDRIISDDGYELVQVFCGIETIAEIKVEDIH